MGLSLQVEPKRAEANSGRLMDKGSRGRSYCASNGHFPAQVGIPQPLARIAHGAAKVRGGTAAALMHESWPAKRSMHQRSATPAGRSRLSGQWLIDLNSSIEVSTSNEGSAAY